jgi:uncharacterized phage protein gp47/JayE
MIQIPTVAQIRDQIISDIESKIGQTIPALPKAFFRVLATALAGVLSLLYRFGGWAYRQIFPQTADQEALVRIGEQYGIIRSPAVAAEITATATGAEGAQIPAGTLWQREGQVYQQTEAQTIETGTATVTVRALTKGAAANVLNGLNISLVTPVAGIDAEAEVTNTDTQGEDIEAVEAYRRRVILRLQQQPQGGAAPDYINWALEVPGIVRAFAFRTDPGEVTVYPLLATTGPSRVPAAPKLAEVLSYIQNPIRRPLCSNVLAVAMDERIFSVNVTAVAPNTTAQKNAIEAAWEKFLYTRYPAQYDDEVDPKNVVSAAALYGEASGAGVQLLNFELYIDGEISEIQFHTLAENEIAKLGTVTWA